jgi:hypothetical protein
VAWLWRLAGAPDPGALPEFPDVGEAHPFGDAIAWAAEEGITGGFPDGLFHGSSPVTRQALAVWIYRYLNRPPTVLPTGFSDVPNDHVYAREIAFVAHAGIASGYLDGTFKPENQITRQAVAAWICRTSAWNPYYDDF